MSPSSRWWLMKNGGVKIGIILFVVHCCEKGHVRYLPRHVGHLRGVCVLPEPCLASGMHAAGQAVFEKLKKPQHAREGSGHRILL